jgi:membrane protein YqaA with SNARE-associated domain
MGFLTVLAAAAWGYAEATTFYVVPDVLIGWAAIRRLRLGVASALAATAGAVIGGAVVHRNAERFRSAQTAIPGIGDAMIADAAERFRRQRWRAVIRAPIDGIPYKVYAAEAGVAGRPLRELVLVTPFARAWRFFAIAVGASLAGTILAPVRRRVGLSLLVYLSVWSATYLAYFRGLDRRYGPRRR